MHFFGRFVSALLFCVLATAKTHATSDARVPVTLPPSIPHAIEVASAGSVHVIANDRGGSVVRYAQELRRLMGQDQLVVFNGQCASACTLFLALQRNRTCIAPGASFVFHRAYGATADMNEWGTDFMIRQYPAWVQNWIARNGGLTNRLLHMDYAYAARFMRPCRVASA